jgi:hypothetical protein
MAKYFPRFFEKLNEKIFLNRKILQYVGRKISPRFFPFCTFADMRESQERME